MRFLRNWLLKTLKLTVRWELNKRERVLHKQIAVLEMQIQKNDEQHVIDVQRLHDTIAELKQTITGLNQIIESRDRSIEALQHTQEILEYDVKGMTSLNARLTKWIESVRIAEEKPVEGENLHQKLADIEARNPWEVT